MERLSSSQDSDCISISLNVQYRMHPDIASFVSQRFYEGSLSSDRIMNWPSVLIFHGKSSAVCIDTSAFTRGDGSHTDASEESTHISLLRNSNIFRASARDTGYMNEGEALLTANTLQRLLQLNEGIEAADIAVIITPYVEQKCAILDKLRVNAYGPAERVTVDTIDLFQGKESRIVVIDLVRSDRGRIGFISDQKRADVAILRANDLLIVIGKFSTIREYSPNPWIDWYSHCASLEFGGLRDKEEDLPHLSLDTGQANVLPWRQRR
jgi:superfamily I DNA and/or RNA helicase